MALTGKWETDVAQRWANDQTDEGAVVLSTGSATAIGGRAENQDAIGTLQLPALKDPTGRPGCLVALADGMGGHPLGDVASTIAIEAVKSAFSGDTAPGDVAATLKQAYRKANETIHQRGIEENVGLSIGTTLVAAVMHGKYATIANVGDSRAYLLRAGRLTQITKDHSLAAEQGSAAESAKGVLTHAVGVKAKLDSKLPSIYEIVLLAEDRLLLSSDGLHGALDLGALTKAVGAGPATDAAHRLIDLAIAANTADNASAIVVAAEPARIREVVAIKPARKPVPLFPVVIAATAVLVLLAVLAFIFFLS